MAELTAAKVIRRVRQRLEVSQEALSRLLNATKGAIQHWERGRNNPDLARLIALRQLCPPGAERKELDALIKQVQATIAPLSTSQPGLGKKVGGAGGRAPTLPPTFPNENLVLLRRQNASLRRQVAKMESTIQRRNEQLRILEDLVRDYQREKGAVAAAATEKTAVAPGTPTSA